MPHSSEYAPRIYVHILRLLQLTAREFCKSLTSKAKGYPFEVALPPGLAVGGVVLADQVKSLDRHIRQIDTIGKAPTETVVVVLAKVAPLFGLRL
jgi:mRNA-degrading endonuclease toxin of MazEF toxin-antitoxin module